MPPVKYVAGSVWGRKQIVAPAGYNKSGHSLYMWRCTVCQKVYGPRAGTEIKKAPYPKRGMEKTNYFGFNDITGQYLAKVKASARKRQILYEVTAEQLWGVWVEQGGRCVYTGRPLTHGVDASLDRIDSAGGYVLGNVQWLHKNVNKIKWEFPEDEFLAICREITEHTKGTHDGNGNCLVAPGLASPLAPGD